MFDTLLDYESTATVIVSMVIESRFPPTILT